MAVYAISQQYGGSAGPSTWTNATFDFGSGMRDASNGFTYYPDYARSSRDGYNQYIDNQLITPKPVGFFTYYASGNQNVSASLGRVATNITSLQSFKHGLFVFDMVWIPNNSCGVQASIAFISSNSTVGYGNKMYLLNYYNNQTFNRFQVDSKTTACKPPSNINSYTGVQPTDYTYTNCSNSDPTAVPSGCVIYSSPNDTMAVGRGFNQNPFTGGGYYALEWTSNHIAMWHFPRSNPPSDITAASPNPAAWPKPAMLMSKTDGCDPDVAFPDPMKIQIITRLCGSGAGSTYQADGCRNGTQDCPSRIALNAPENAYWVLNQITAYQDPNDPVATSQATCSVPVQDPYFGNVSTPSVPLGCYNDLSNFSGFQKTSTSSGMTAAQCFNVCGSQAYSAVSGNDCYCSYSITKIS